MGTTGVFGTLECLWNLVKGASSLSSSVGAATCVLLFHTYCLVLSSSAIPSVLLLSVGFFVLFCRTVNGSANASFRFFFF